MTFVWVALAILAHETGHALAAEAKRLPWRVRAARIRGVPVAPAVLAPPSVAVALGGPLGSVLAAVALWQVAPLVALVTGVVGGPLSLVPFPRSDGAALIAAWGALR